MKWNQFFDLSELSMTSKKVVQTKKKKNSNKKVSIL